MAVDGNWNITMSTPMGDRNTTLSLASPLDQTVTNLPFDASGNLVASRSQPKNAGVGVANGYQASRTLQAQIRFSF